VDSYAFELGCLFFAQTKKLLGGQKMPQNNVLSLFELCHLLKISRSTLWRMMKTKPIPYHRLGHKIIFTQNDIEAILKNCEVPASTGAIK
jgi:excisionase family DNA binding protein